MYENRYNWTWSQVFEERARKPLEAKERTNKKLNPHMESTPYIYLGNCQILVCGIFSTSHLTISPLVASWLVAIGLLGSDMIWWGDDRIHCLFTTVCWSLKGLLGTETQFRPVALWGCYWDVNFYFIGCEEVAQETGSKFVSSNSPLPVLQWYGHSRVLGIPIPKTLMIYSAPVVLTLTSRR